jgi:ER lumen protein retaining receptor
VWRAINGLEATKSELESRCASTEIDSDGGNFIFPTQRRIGHTRLLRPNKQIPPRDSEYRNSPAFTENSQSSAAGLHIILWLDANFGLVAPPPSPFARTAVPPRDSEYRNSPAFAENSQSSAAGLHIILWLDTNFGFVAQPPPFARTPFHSPVSISYSLLLSSGGESHTHVSSFSAAQRAARSTSRSTLTTLGRSQCAMNVFRLSGDGIHVLSIILLVLHTRVQKSVAGLSFKTQLLYAMVYITRYLGDSPRRRLTIDLFWSWNSQYNILMKSFFIVSSLYILYLIKGRYRSTHDSTLDTVKIEFLVVFAMAQSLLANYGFSFTEVRKCGSVFLTVVDFMVCIYMA